MSWIPQERPRFAWLTNDGELILFDEIHSEVRHALRRAGVDLDPWPLTATLCALQRVTERLLADQAGLPTPDELVVRVEDELRQTRTILTRPTIAAVIGAYLDQLRNHDIARVHHF